MDFVLEGHGHEHAVQTIVQVFYPNEGYKRLEAVPEKGKCVVSWYRDGTFGADVFENGAQIISCRGDRPRSPEYYGDKKIMTQGVAAAIFQALVEVTGYRPPWGTLTGVRPAKLLTEGRGVEYLKTEYLVNDDKIKLCEEVSVAEIEYINSSNVDDVGVYIGVPFCLSRCGYCSFTSFPLEKHGKYREAYFAALCKEIKFLGDILCGRRVTAVYVGGGTPTALETGMLSELLRLIRECFHGEYEFTVEGGQPSSLKATRLQALADYGVNRLAINPQSLNNETLANIGRNHTAEEFINVFNMAREMGFDNINCDLIIGLPGETPDDTAFTFTELEKLSPESITVHILAMKRAADFNHSYGRYGKNELDTGRIEKMLEISGESCRRMGMQPYYMYRQKNMVGNFENVGYVKPGYQSIYNHMTMTEARSIFAAGAGAVTKLINHEKNLITRAFNVKNLYEYIERVDEMIERKKKLL